MPYQSKCKSVKNEDRLWKESAKRVREDAPWNEFENAANALGYSQDYIDRMYALYQN